MDDYRKARITDAIVTLTGDLRSLTDFHEFPCLLESFLRKQFPLDWLALGIFSDRDIGYNIVTNPSLPFDWNDKYREIHDFDIIRTTALSQPVGGTYCYRLPSHMLSF